jgi:hypothetical protein
MIIYHNAGTASTITRIAAGLSFRPVAGKTMACGYRIIAVVIGCKGIFVAYIVR